MSKKWQIVQLGEILKERREAPTPDDLALGRVRIVSKISFDSGRIELRTGSETGTGMILARPGDLLISGINAAKGAIAIYKPENAEPIAATIHYGAYTPKPDRADLKFLWWFFRSQFFRQLLTEHVPGGIKTELKSKRFLPIPVPLPPLAEQRRLVARIEEVASEISEARALRHEASEGADALYASELGATFDRLATEYPVLSLGEVTSHILDGPHVTPSYLPEGATGVPFVTVKNMVTGKLDFSNLNYVSVEDHRLFTRRCKAEFGDVLYSKDGATRGRPCFVDTNREFSYFVSVALIKPMRDRLDGHYLAHILNSNWIKDRMVAKSRGDMIPHIVLREIRAFPVPLPALPEQRRIVSELDALKAEVDGLKRFQAETAAELDAMLPAILDRTFKGEL